MHRNLDNQLLELLKEKRELTISQISEKLKVGTSTISRRLKILNVPTPLQQKDIELKESILNMYKEGMNDTVISKKLQVSLPLMSRFRKLHNLPTNPNFYYEPTELTFQEEQILIGGMLGDMHMSINGYAKNASGMFAQTTGKQEDYCWWKYEHLKRFCRVPFNTSQKDKRTKRTYYKTVCVLYTNSVFNPYYYAFYKNKKKLVPKELLYKLEGLGLATWFMDDGGKSKNTYMLSTNSFSSEDLILIKDFFKNKFDIKCNIHASGIIYILKESAEKFKTLISPFIIDCMKYKL
jgi:hypothetical protein